MKCRPLLGSGIAVVLLILIAACGSSGTGTSSSAITTAASSSKPAPTAPADLSGTWSGRAISVDTHAMSITWHQSGSNLSGKITFSNPTEVFNINGTLHGSTISFSTVGPVVITFTGSVSGNSMSGSFQEAASSGGSWDASKTS